MFNFERKTIQRHRPRRGAGAAAGAVRAARDGHVNGGGRGRVAPRRFRRRRPSAVDRRRGGRGRVRVAGKRFGARSNATVLGARDAAAASHDIDVVDVIADAAVAAAADDDGGVAVPRGMPGRMIRLFARVFFVQGNLGNVDVAEARTNARVAVPVRRRGKRIRRKI